jgi:cysteine desulfuration protein SufE
MHENSSTIQDKIIEEFSQLEDWFDTYEHLIHLGKNLKPTDETIQTDAYAISGCQSQVWLKAETKNGRIHYVADSDSLIVKGMISLLLRVINDQRPEDIVKADFHCKTNQILCGGGNENLWVLIHLTLLRNWFLLSS